MVGIVVLALALGLGLGLGLKKNHYVTTNSTFLLDPSFDVFTTTTTTRYYEWVIEEMTGAPDGFERTMLVVNGEGTRITCRIFPLICPCRPVPGTAGRGQQR